MDYKNFLLRSFISLIFISIYLVCLLINFNLVFYLIFIIYILVFIEVLIYFKEYKFIPLIYISTSFLFLNFIEFNKENFFIFNLFIILVISFDIFSYIIGKYFGKNKLIKISPRKTIEGLIGGVLFSIIFGYIFINFVSIKIGYDLIFFIFLIISSAFIGDIIESFFKRKNNLKNSSFFVPGHGGLFDRFDSFLFSIIFYSIFNNTLI